MFPEIIKTHTQPQVMFHKRSVKCIDVIRGFSKLNPSSLSACQPVSPPALRNVEAVLISGFTNSEIRITSNNLPNQKKIYHIIIFNVVVNLYFSEWIFVNHNSILHASSYDPPNGQA